MCGKHQALLWRATFRVQATMASGAVDICLIPEVPFDLDGEMGMLSYVRRVLARKGHCVICIAEGAGQVRARDASGASGQCRAELWSPSVAAFDVECSGATLAHVCARPACTSSRAACARRPRAHQGSQC
jgi:6-phosphofructokinase